MSKDKQTQADSIDLLLNLNTQLRTQDINEVKSLISEFIDKLKRELANDLDQIIVYGSLCTGDFDLHLSDVNLLIVTKRDLIETDLFVLSHLHNALKNQYSIWFERLEVSYISSQEIYQKTPPKAPRICLSQGKTSRIPYGAQWYFQKYMLRSSGLVLYGGLLDKDKLEVSSTNLRVAGFQILMDTWQPLTQRAMHHMSPDLLISGVLTMCRLICTIEEGHVLSSLNCRTQSARSLSQ